LSNYYLDIETTGLEPIDNKVITIQWCEIERYTGKKVGELNILKEWESSEKEILEEFADAVTLTDPYAFTFIPIGYNLGFEHKFLSYRSDFHKTFPIEINTRPHIDLHQLAILLNGGEFKGTKLNDMTNKPSDGKSIPTWYENKEFDKINEYIVKEAEEFIGFIEWAYKTTPTLLPGLKDHFNN
jgi:hypothetical protein